MQNLGSNKNGNLLTYDKVVSGAMTHKSNKPITPFSFTMDDEITVDNLKKLSTEELELVLYKYQ